MFHLQFLYPCFDGNIIEINLLDIYTCADKYFRVDFERVVVTVFFLDNQVFQTFRFL